MPLLILLLIPSLTFAQQTSPNAGFVTGIWYSDLPFFAGDDIRIYAAIQNRSDFDITGKARFSDNGVPMGTMSFSTLQGRLVEVWTDWKAIEGEHSFSVEIVEAKKSKAGKSSEPISLSFPFSQPSEVFVDIDTDKDTVGNKEDTDDDNDTLSDEQEISHGTNPLLKDTDKDGVLDPHEISYGTNPSQAEEPSAQKDDAIGEGIRKADAFIASLAGQLQRTQETIREEIVRDVPKKRILESQVRQVESIFPPSSFLLAKVPSFNELKLFAIQTLTFFADHWKISLLALGGLFGVSLLRRFRKK